MWPDWAILTLRGDKFFFKSSPNIWSLFGLLWKLLCQLFWATCDKFGLHLIPASGHTACCFGLDCESVASAMFVLCSRRRQLVVPMLPLNILFNLDSERVVAGLHFFINGPLPASLLYFRLWNTVNRKCYFWHVFGVPGIHIFARIWFLYAYLGRHLASIFFNYNCTKLVLSYLNSWPDKQILTRSWQQILIQN